MVRVLSFILLASLAGDLDVLRKLVAEDPAKALQLASLAESAATGASASQRAEILDLKGQALLGLDRSAEAADSFRAALALDEGTPSLIWLADDGRVAWTAPLDPGEGRHERAARSHLAAGRRDAARALLARALAAGAEGWPRETWPQLGGGSVPGLDPSPSGLMAGTWFPPLPDVELKLHDGGSFRLSSARGKVLLLDFWASWCAPCLHELPSLQALQEAQKDAGLVVVTVNARESVQAARSAAQALGLSLPVSFYDGAAERAFNVRTLPTILLADRDGKIRTRWDRYVPDFEGEVAVRVKSLLRGDPEGSQRRVAEVLAGGGSLRIEWMRELARPIGGVAVVSGPKGEPRIAVTAGDQLLVLRGDGAVEHRHDLPQGRGGSLRRAGTPGEGRFDLVSFRPGAKDLVWIDSLTGVTHAWSAAAPLLDLAVLPSSSPLSGARLLLGSIEGFSVTDAAGQETAWKEVAGPVSGVAIPGSGTPARIAILGEEGRLVWVDPSLRILGSRPVPEGSRRLLFPGGESAGVGLLPRAAASAAHGRFLEGERLQAAVATVGGQLVLVDLVTGEVRFRARWPDVTAVAAGDVDGDGREELLVAAGRSLAVLRRP